MLVRVRKTVALSVMLLLVAVFSLPVASIAATSPVVTVLSPIDAGLIAPAKMVLDAEGNAYIVDKRAGGVVKVDYLGVRQSVIRTASDPTSLAFAQDGSLLVGQSSFVARYDIMTGLETGRLADGYLRLPSGIALDGVGNIYVTDSGAKQVVVFASDGSYIKSFGQGLLLAPTGISFEKVSGQMAVADAKNNKIQFFDTNLGTIVRSLGKAVSSSTTSVVNTTIGALQFEAPVAIAFEYSKTTPTALSRLYVVDSFQHRVQAIDAAAMTFFKYIGSPGTTNGLLMTPSDALFDAVNSRLLIANGFGNITIYGIDGGKNPVYVDKTPPVFTVNPVQSEIATDSITISGTVEAGATVQVATGASQISGVVQGTSWSALVSGLALGSNDLIVTAKDSAANVAAGQTVSVTYLLPAPVVTISPVSAITNNSSLMLSGTVDAGASVTINNQSTVVAGSAVVVDAAWNYDVVLTEGVNSLVVSAHKENSFKSSAFAAITLDTIAPGLDVSALPSGSRTNVAVQNFSGSVSDTNVVTVTLNDEPVELTNNTFTLPVNLQAGTNEIVIKAVDAAGNYTVDSRTFYFDASAPVVDVLNLSDNSFTASQTLQLSGTVNKTSTVNVAGAPVVVNNDNSWSATVELVTGVNTIDIVATDLYGNSASVKRTVILDTEKPELSIVSPAQDVAVHTSSVVVAGSVADSTAYSVECSVNTANIPVPIASDGTFSLVVDFVEEGIYPVTVTVIDAAGNTSTVVRNVIYDVTAPVFTMNKVSVAAPVNLSGTLESGASVAVFNVTSEGAVSVGSVVVVGDIWSVDLSGVAYTPSALVAVATDVAGNTTNLNLSDYVVITTAEKDKGKSKDGKGNTGVQTGDQAVKVVVNNASATGMANASVEMVQRTEGLTHIAGKASKIKEYRGSRK